MASLNVVVLQICLRSLGCSNTEDSIYQRVESSMPIFEQKFLKFIAKPILIHFSRFQAESNMATSGLIQNISQPIFDHSINSSLYLVVNTQLHVHVGGFLAVYS